MIRTLRTTLILQGIALQLRAFIDRPLPADDWTLEEAQALGDTADRIDLLAQPIRISHPTNPKP